MRTDPRRLAMRRAWNVAKRLYADERGAEGLEKLLILAAIVLPLLAVLFIFRDGVSSFARNMWNKIVGDAGDPILNPGDVDIPQ